MGGIATDPFGGPLSITVKEEKNEERKESESCGHSFGRKEERRKEMGWATGKGEGGRE